MGISLRERNLAKNTYAFIRGFRRKTLSEEKIMKYRKRLNDPKTAEKELGFALVLLDRETHYEKADLLGRAYRAFVDEKMTWEKFAELAEAINRMFMIDITHLRRVAKSASFQFEDPEEEVYGMQRLEGIGLISEKKPYASNHTLFFDGGYIITSLGGLIIYLLDEDNVK